MYLPHTFDPVKTAAARLCESFGRLLLSGGSAFSLMSLFCTLVIAVAWLLLRRRRPRPLPLKVLVRALFPKRIWAHASTRADIGYLCLNMFVTGTLVGWGLVSGQAIFTHASAFLQKEIGTPPVWGLPDWLAVLILTCVMFVAYDFAYWLDHYLKHKVPCLWAFHRTHHTAEVLSPLTSFRVHPVDSLIFANILAVIIGVCGGTTQYLLGGTVQPATFSGTNCILVAFFCTTVHLQHSHIRIAFTGRLGHILFSPAHHQIHHSSDPAHYDSNLGSCLAVWDWMFNTLHMPKPNIRLQFGTSSDGEDPHSATGSLVYPFIDSARKSLPRRPPVIQQAE